MINTKKIIAALGVAAVLGSVGFAVTSYAHEGKRDGGMRWRGGMNAMMDQYDTNKDGVLGVEEAKAARAAQFKKFDTNGDGKMDLKEYEALWNEAMRHSMVDRFQKYDDDGDGSITSEDYGKRFGRMLGWMDRDHDGMIGGGPRGKGEHEHENDREHEGRKGNQ